MSHITTIKTQVEVICEPCLRKALEKLKQTIPDFNYVQVGKNYQVNYPQINHSYAPSNMLFKQRMNKDNKPIWVIVGDRYSVKDEFDRVQKEFELHYTTAGMEQILSKNMYSTRTSTHKEGIMILATEY